MNEHLIIFLSPGTPTTRRRHLRKNPTSSDEKAPYCFPCSSRSVSDPQSTRSIARRCLGCESHCRTCDGHWIMRYQWRSWVSHQTIIQANNHPYWHKNMEDRSNHSHRFGYGFLKNLQNLRKELPISDQQWLFVEIRNLILQLRSGLQAVSNNLGTKVPFWYTSCFICFQLDKAHLFLKCWRSLNHHSATPLTRETIESLSRWLGLGRSRLGRLQSSATQPLWLSPIPNYPEKQSTSFRWVKQNSKRFRCWGSKYLRVFSPFKEEGLQRKTMAKISIIKLCSIPSTNLQGYRQSHESRAGSLGTGSGDLAIKCNQRMSLLRPNSWEDVSNGCWLSIFSAAIFPEQVD